MSTPGRGDAHARSERYTTDASLRAAALVAELRAELGARDDLMTDAEWIAAKALYRVACERMPQASDEIIRREVSYVWAMLERMEAGELPGIVIGNRLSGLG